MRNRRDLGPSLSPPDYSSDTEVPLLLLCPLRAHRVPLQHLGT